MRCARTWPRSAGAWCAGTQAESTGADRLLDPRAHGQEPLLAAGRADELEAGGQRTARGNRHRRAGTPARFTGSVQRETRRSSPSSSRGGKMLSVGVTMTSTRSKARRSSASNSRWVAQAARTVPSSNDDPMVSRSLTSAPIPSGSRAMRASSEDQASTTSRRPAYAVAWCQAWANGSSAHSQPVSRTARSIAALMTGSASRTEIEARAKIGNVGSPAPPGESGFEQIHARDQSGHVPGHRADGVEAGRQRPHPLERDAPPGRLEPGRAAAGGGDPHGATGVTAVGDVGLARGHRHGRAARGAARDQRRVERIDRRPEPRVDPGHPESELMQIGAPHDAGTGRPRPGQAPRVPRGRLRRLLDGAAAGRGRLARHVDEVLHRQPDARARGVVPSDEGGHAPDISSPDGRLGDDQFAEE